MEAASVVMKETAVSSVELVDAVCRVLRCVRMNNVQQHHQSQTMRCVDQFLQLFGSTVPTTNKAFSLVPVNDTPKTINNYDSFPDYYYYLDAA